LDARRLELSCDARNERSRRVAERCGFVFEGRLRNAMTAPANEAVDALVFSLTPADRTSAGG
jgi:RimJ/RimL family protein N-acetyltransferase